MTINIKPSKIEGRISAPSSKSMGHRLLICASLANGESCIENILYSEDILATIDCIEAMGAKVEKGNDYVKVYGAIPKRDGKIIYKCRESGSTLRFFIPIAMLSEEKSLFAGYGRLMERPMTVYESIAREKNLTYIKNGDGITVGGPLTAGNFKVAGNISSQFISGLLFALALCEGDSEIEIIGNIESKSYIDMTLYAMSLFGVEAIWKNENTLYIKGSQEYKSRNLSVEGDYSNTAFLDAFNYIGGNVKVEGLNENSLQGDKVYKEYFSLLQQGTPTLDIKNCPDLAPVLMALAVANNGCKLVNTVRLKLKESDRGFAMAKELSKFGADIEVYDNEIVINKAKLYRSKDDLYCHNDHRVVMSLAVLASLCGGILVGTEAVKKSFPDFFDKVKALGLEFDLYDD